MHELYVFIRCFEYRTFNSLKGICQIEATRVSDGHVVVIATELKDNPGMSITNAAAWVATDVCRYLGIDPKKLIWIEYYGYPPPPGFKVSRTYDRVTFREITPQSEPFFHGPIWSAMKDADWRALRLAPRTS